MQIAGMRLSRVLFVMPWPAMLLLGATTATQTNDGLLLDTVHHRVSLGLAGTVDQFDRLFGEDRILEESRQTRLRLRSENRFDHRDGLTLSQGVGLRLALPRFGRRLHLLLDDEATVTDADSSAERSGFRDQSTTDAALRYIFRHDAEKFLSADLGLRSGDRLAQLMIRLRGRIIVPYPVWELRLTETVDWLSDDGWRNQSEILWSRPCGHNRLFQSRSSLTWTSKHGGVTPAQSLRIARQHPSGRALRLSANAVWPEVPGVDEAAYSLVLAYRRRVLRHWLACELSPQLGFRQADGYRANPGIALRVEILFDLTRPPNENGIAPPSN